MLRDEAIKALEAQDSNAEVQVIIGDHLIDIERVEYMAERDAIVLSVPTDDLRDVLGHVVKGECWRGSHPGGFDCPVREVNSEMPRTASEV